MQENQTRDQEGGRPRAGWRQGARRELCDHRNEVFFQVVGWEPELAEENMSPRGVQNDRTICKP